MERKRLKYFKLKLNFSKKNLLIFKGILVILMILTLLYYFYTKEENLYKNILLDYGHNNGISRFSMDDINKLKRQGLFGDEGLSYTYVGNVLSRNMVQGNYTLGYYYKTGQYKVINIYKYHGINVSDGYYLLYDTFYKGNMIDDSQSYYEFFDGTYDLWLYKSPNGIGGSQGSNFKKILLKKEKLGNFGCSAFKKSSMYCLKSLQSYLNLNFLSEIERGILNDFLEKYIYKLETGQDESK